jgi:succinoglycan biosynthesis protein ExoM
MLWNSPDRVENGNPVMRKVCILICTFNRPELLRKLLQALKPQARLHESTVVIVDNGTAPSEAIVAAFQKEMNIVYQRLAEPGLVSARNAALRLALTHGPEFLAFIDDDEVPEAGWLSALIERLEESGADFATGPVIPDYAAPPPRWAVEGEFFHKSGETLCTSNLIMRAACLPTDESQWFRPEFNFSGGEDKEFLARMAAGGAVHTVAKAAIVREAVPASRMKSSYIWRRGLRDGVVIAEIISLGSTSRAGFVARVICRAAQKLGYALNHLFWTVKSPWRFNNAISDLAAVAGIVLRSVGLRIVFYGSQQ